jgi:hypothetical protein
MIILSTSFYHYCYCSKRKVEKIIILKIVALYKYHYSKKKGVQIYSLPTKSKITREHQKNNTQTTVKKNPNEHIIQVKLYIIAKFH